MSTGVRATLVDDQKSNPSPLSAREHHQGFFRDGRDGYGTSSSFRGEGAAASGSFVSGSSRSSVGGSSGVVGSPTFREGFSELAGGETSFHRDGRHFKRKYTKLIEVPFTKHVKVPVRDLQKIIEEPLHLELQYPVVQAEEAFEEYLEPRIEERVVTKYRPREVWRKVIVDEEYDYEVPVQKTRIVSHPYIAFEEREVEQEVVLASTKPVWVHAYRIDEIEGYRIMEVEEFQEYQEVAHAVGDRIVGESLRTIGTKKQEGRFYGQKYYPDFANELVGLDVDESKEKFGEVLLERENCDYLEAFEADLVVEEPALVLTQLDLTNELFTVKNVSNRPVHLDGWTVKDENARGHEEGRAARNTFEFSKHAPGRVLNPGATISVYSGKDSDKKFDWAREKDKVHWFNVNVWNNEGDKAYLFNPERQLVHSLNVNDTYKIFTKYGKPPAGEGSSRGQSTEEVQKLVKVDWADFPKSPLSPYMSPRGTPRKRTKTGSTR